MKLLLTSQGIYNESIKQALADLLEKPFAKSNIVCITTSVNGSAGDKRWFLRILQNIEAAGFQKIDILDFSMLPEDMLLSRLEAADVIYFVGGQTAFLLDEIARVNLEAKIVPFFDQKIMMGNSAGCHPLSAGCDLSNPSGEGYAKERTTDKPRKTFGLVPFQVRSHYNNPKHAISTKEWVETTIKEKGITDKVYLIDDNSAIKVNGDTVEVISEGEWCEFN